MAPIEPPGVIHLGISPGQPIARASPDQKAQPHRAAGVAGVDQIVPLGKGEQRVGADLAERAGGDRSHPNSFERSYHAEAVSRWSRQVRRVHRQMLSSMVRLSSRIRTSSRL